MYIVPLKGDQLELRGQDVLSIASSYTAYKDEPAVYIRAALADGSRTVPLTSILKVNDVPVTFDDDSNCLRAHAKVRRRYDLPQPGQEVTYTFEDAQGNDTDMTGVIALIRLHGRENRAFMMKLDNGIWLQLSDIKAIKRPGRFDRGDFQKYYIDYAAI
jgi:hypothetical protein